MQFMLILSVVEQNSVGCVDPLLVVDNSIVTGKTERNRVNIHHIKHELSLWRSLRLEQNLLPIVINKLPLFTVIYNEVHTNEEQKPSVIIANYQA